MHRNRALLLAVLAAAAPLAAGCGSDDSDDAKSKAASETTTATTAGGKPQAAERETAKPKKAKKKSVRDTMIECLENQGGFDVKTGDDDQHLSIAGSGGKVQASLIIHSNPGDAKRATISAQEKGRNAVNFGRVEFIRRSAAGDMEAGIIANCVNSNYVRR